jgi:hypothetical protein
MDVRIPDRSSGTENEAKRGADNVLQRALNRDMSPQRMDYLLIGKDGQSIFF